MVIFKKRSSQCYPKVVTSFHFEMLNTYIYFYSSRVYLMESTIILYDITSICQSFGTLYFFKDFMPPTYTHMRACTHTHRHVCKHADTYEGQKRASDPLEQKLQMVLRGLPWVLGTELSPLQEQ